MLNRIVGKTASQRIMFATALFAVLGFVASLLGLSHYEGWTLPFLGVIAVGMLLGSGVGVRQKRRANRSAAIRR